MAHRRKFLTPDKQHEEQLREERKQVDRQVQEEHRRLSELIAERRKEAKLSRAQLAAIAGISPSTIRNLERGRCKSLSQETLNRLRSVQQLRLPLSLEDKEPKLANGYASIWLPDYDPHFLTKQAQESLLDLNSRMPYSELRYTKEGVDFYQFSISTGIYGRVMSSLHRALKKMADKIPKYKIHNKLDIICLTIGHGWGEIKLVEELLYKQPGWLGKVGLVSENDYLIAHGLYNFEQKLAESSVPRAMIIPILGRHTSYVKTLDSASFRGRQRLFCLLGTLMNLDHGAEFIRSLSHKMSVDDLLLFDVNTPFGQLSDRKKILNEDTRLLGRLPKQFQTSVEQSIEFDFRITDPSIEEIEWSYQLDDLYEIASNSMEEYSVHVNAKIYRSSAAPQGVSCMRIHRHDHDALARLLASHGLFLVEQVQREDECGVQYPNRILLFVRK